MDDDAEHLAEDEEEDVVPELPTARRNSQESIVRIPWKARIKRYSLSEFWLSVKIGFNLTMSVVNALMITYDLFLMEQNEGAAVVRKLWFNIIDVAIAVSLIGGVCLRIWFQWSSVREYFDSFSNLVDGTVAVLSLTTLPIAYFDLSQSNEAFNNFYLLSSLRAYRDVIRLGRQFYFVKWTLSAYLELKIVKEGYVDVDEPTAHFLSRRNTTRTNMMISTAMSNDSSVGSGADQESPNNAPTTETMWRKVMADACIVPKR